LGKLHHDCRVKTGNMGELKVRPGFSARQLRFGERAGNPSLVATGGFPFRQCQQELSVAPILLGGSMFDRLPIGQEVVELEAFEHRRQGLVGTRLGLEIGVGRVGHSSIVRAALKSLQEQVGFS